MNYRIFKRALLEISDISLKVHVFLQGYANQGGCETPHFSERVIFFETEISILLYP